MTHAIQVSQPYCKLAALTVMNSIRIQLLDCCCTVYGKKKTLFIIHFSSVAKPLRNRPEKTNWNLPACGAEKFLMEIRYSILYPLILFPYQKNRCKLT